MGWGGVWGRLKGRVAPGPEHMRLINDPLIALVIFAVCMLEKKLATGGRGMVGQFPARVKMGIGCLNLALSGAQKWTEKLHHLSIHYSVLLIKLSNLSTHTWGENSFSHPLLI